MKCRAKYIKEVDIELVPVLDDPRTWSPTRKNVVLFIISAAAMIAGLAANIQNPAIQQMQEQLPATSSQISLSLSLFILSQGSAPLLWSALSEIKGRKLVYILSIGLSTVGCVVTALASNIGLVIGFRCLQGVGSSSVVSLGAATLADLYPPSIRGTKMGIYYAAPLLGPSLGPILGGVLTAGFSWRACFWFMAIFSGASFLTFLLFLKDTWRKERSLTYQNVLRTRLRELAGDEDKWVRGDGKKTSPSPDHASSVTEIAATSAGKSGLATDPMADDNHTTVAGPKSDSVPPDVPDIKLSFSDVNPIQPLWLVLRRPNNFIILLASGSLYAFGFLISYTTARTLGNMYHYNALKIGLVLLSFGLGNLAGSVLGGRYSDYTYRKHKNECEGRASPETRLRSTFLGMVLLPPCILGFGWVSQQHLPIAAMCAFLFLNGFFSIWIYASTLAYILDANNGRSSTAVAANSTFRGLFAFFATEIAVPLQDAVGDGWMYTIWGMIMVATEFLIFIVIWKGGKWREQSEKREAESRFKL
ncbi:MFS transporter superfamily protein [Pleurotus pulmonarius]